MTQYLYKKKKITIIELLILLYIIFIYDQLNYKYPYMWLSRDILSYNGHFLFDVYLH